MVPKVSFDLSHQRETKHVLLREWEIIQAHAAQVLECKAVSSTEFLCSTTQACRGCYSLGSRRPSYWDTLVVNLSVVHLVTVF